MTADEAVQKIRAALRSRSQTRWSVRRGSGTASGWIDILPMPKELDEFGQVKQIHVDELNALFGGRVADNNGISIPASAEHRREYVDRANGLAPSVIGVPYWD